MISKKPSDSAFAPASYSTGIGYYTTTTLVTDLLGIAPITDTTLPDYAHIGELIKRAEDYIDEYTKESWRPTLVENEYHDFDYDWHRMYRSYQSDFKYTDYVGFVKLHHENVRKIVRMSAWKGGEWDELASATTKIQISDHTQITNIVLTAGPKTFTLLTHPTDSGSFNNQYGIATTAQEIAYLINEQFPVKTREFTGGSGAKSLSGISNYFYATVEPDNTIIISSLLPRDDGKDCTVQCSGSGLTPTSSTNFTDNEAAGRDADWWDISSDGMVFFRSQFPYQQKHTMRVTYMTGQNRVPAIITEAATKLVACELMQADDNNLLLGENAESGVDLKTKYDAYRQDIERILLMKKRMIYVIDSD